MTISATAATSGQIMQLVGSQWAPVNFVTDPTMGGDIANKASTSKVVKIQGRVLPTTNPTNGQLLECRGAVGTEDHHHPVDLDLDPERGSERRDANYPARCCSTVARNGDRSAVGGDLTGTASAAAGGGYTWRSRAKIA